MSFALKPGGLQGYVEAMAEFSWTRSEMTPVREI